MIGGSDGLFARTLISSPLLNFSNKMAFAIDVREILRCEYFLINLNGSTPDDGAMAELGIAFALGKPIVCYGNDTRCLPWLRDSVILPSAFGLTPASSLQQVVLAMEQAKRLVQSMGESRPIDQILPANLRKIIKSGIRYGKILQAIKILGPKHPMAK